MKLEELQLGECGESGRALLPHLRKLICVRLGHAFDKDNGLSTTSLQRLYVEKFHLLQDLFDFAPLVPGGVHQLEVGCLFADLQWHGL